MADVCTSLVFILFKAFNLIKFAWLFGIGTF